jgi:DNA-directed RNA polymerase specialized sigma24 family protein
MRRPRQTHLKPEYLESGTIGLSAATHDEYFTARPEPTLRIVLDRFVEHVPEPQRSAMEMCVMKRMTYKEAAEYFTEQRGKTTDPKTVWRWARQGVKIVGKMLARTPWAGAMLPALPEWDDETEG